MTGTQFAALRLQQRLMDARLTQALPDIAINAQARSPSHQAPLRQ